jgi:hypothetical protein
MARKADETSDLVFVQLIGQETNLYDRSHPDCVRRDKVGLAWGKISHKKNECGTCANVYRVFHDFSAYLQEVIS